MDDKIKKRLLNLLQQHKSLGISQQVDFDKFYLYSIITHSTAIEGSTVTEVEAQLLFDEGITSSRRTINEQLMNLDLKTAYEFGMQWITKHQPITVDWLVALSAKVMARTGSEYNSIGGHFDASKGELRTLNVTAGRGGRSYLSYLKVPIRLSAFCRELNQYRRKINSDDVAAVYELSFWAHFQLVTIHPWADGNGRTSRLLMNLLQMEYGVLPSKVLKEDKADYIQALIDAREGEDVSIFTDFMAQLHCQHLQSDIDQFLVSFNEKMADKQNNIEEMVDKWSIKLSLAEKMVDILLYMSENSPIETKDIVDHFGYTTTTAKRYLRQLTTFGYLSSQGGNKNRRYTLKKE